MKYKYYLKKSIIILLILLLTSCKGVEFSNSKVSSAQEFTYGQVMILSVEEKNKYEDKFGTQIWTIKNGNGNRNYKDYVVNNIKLYVEKLMTLILYAKKNNIAPTNKDREKLMKATKDYVDGLTNDDLDYIMCSEQDVYNLYYNYRTVCLAIDDMTRNSNIELSISEAKVIKAQYIVTNTKERADEIRKGVLQAGASFAYYARQYSEDKNIEMTIKRGDNISVLFPEVFYLATNEVSQVLTNSNKYYIFKCTNDYLKQETRERKEEILSNLKNKEFNEQFALFEKENRVLSNASYWSSIDFAKGDRCKTNNFYAIYDKYFAEASSE